MRLYSLFPFICNKLAFAIQKTFHYFRIEIFKYELHLFLDKMRSKLVGFAVYVALLIVLLGLISMTFNLHRLAFMGEFLILLVLLLVAVISVVGMHSKFAWSWKLLKVFFALAFLDMLLAYFLSASMPGMFPAFLFA